MGFGILTKAHQSVKKLKESQKTDAVDHHQAAFYQF